MSSDAPEGGEGEPDPSGMPDVDGLEHAHTPMARLLSRSRWWIALVVAIAMVVPAGGRLIDELAFRDSGASVEAQLADETFLADAVLRVRALDCSGRVSTGSAFVIEVGGDELLVTNRHVVEEARTIGVRPLDGGASVLVRRRHLSQVADVAVLELARSDATGPRPLSAAESSTAGQRVRVIGFPGGRAAVSTGRITAAAPGRMELDVLVDPGASGSPVVDEDGAVVGQVFARTSDGRGVATPLARMVEAAATVTPGDAPC